MQTFSMEKVDALPYKVCKIYISLSCVRDFKKKYIREIKTYKEGATKINGNTLIFLHLSILVYCV